MNARACVAGTVALAMLLGACEAEHHVVSPDELAQRGYDPSKTVELVEAGGQRHRMAVHEIVERCTTEKCEHAMVDLGDTTHFNKGEATAVFLSVLTVGSLVCAVGCGKPYNYIADGVLAVEGAVVVIGAIVVIKVMADLVKHKR